ncbi:MAG: Type pilus secretin PilQ/competence protein [Acidobacteria bacterium]|nr:Type pilus secretin PilQ/competence protein [Acidobacteriota bacterium]
MLHQPRFSTAIRRTTLVLLQVCLYGVLAVATPKEPPTITNPASRQATLVTVPAAVVRDVSSTAGTTAASAATAQQPMASPSPTPRPALVASPGRQQPDQGQHYGESGFVGEPINLNVVNADIRDLLNYITEQYGINFVIDKSVTGVSVTVNVQDVPWNLALDAVLKANRLGVEVSGNILRVATTEVLAKESDIQKVLKESRLDASGLVTEIIRLNYARALESLNGASGGTAVFTGGLGRDSQYMQEAYNGGANSIRSNDASLGILPIIQRRLSRRGSVEVDGRTNTLIVTDVKENIDSIRQLVVLLDQPEPQVEIETRIVIANRSFSRDLGFQLNALALNTATGATAGFGTAKPSPLANSTGGSANTIGLRPSGIPQGILDPSGALGANLPSTVIGLTTGMIGTAQISALITAAESKGQVKIIATPRVTALNNRPAQIESGQQIPVVTPQTGAGGTGGVLVFTTTFVSVPLRLSVTPQITDAGTVILRIVAENNSVNTAIAINGTPGIDTQRMSSEVLVPDGGTTVVGGVLGENENEIQNRTPGLGSIPVLGNLFKRKLITRQSNEILFFITPRIYRPDYQGKPTTSVVGTGNRTVTIPQPVPLGNPPSNTAPVQPTQQQAPAQNPSNQSNPSPPTQKPGGDHQ